MSAMQGGAGLSLPVNAADPGSPRSASRSHVTGRLKPAPPPSYPTEEKEQ